MAQLNFDASQVAPATGTGDALPAGWYNVAMDESEHKPTSKGNGDFFLNCRFNILDGQYAGRKFFSRLNIKNSNPVAQEIAYKELSAICHATGVIQVQDSSQLHGKPLKVKVKVRKATDDYEASNEITAYKNVNEVVEMAAAAPGGGGVPAGFGGGAGGAGGAGGVPGGFGTGGGASAQQQFQPQPGQQFQPQQQQMQPMMQMQGQPVMGQQMQPAQQQQFVPQQQPGQQAPAGAQGQWQAPAAAQPWANGVAPQQALQPAQQQPQQQMQQAQQFQPQFDPAAAQQQQFQPQQMQQPVQQQQQFQPQQMAPVQQQMQAQPNPVVQQFAGQAPPWETQPAQ